MNKQITISLYFRNHEINPSNYYRIYQYIKDLPGKYFIHDTAPSFLYNKSLNSKSQLLQKFAKVILFILISFRLCYYYISDYFFPKDIIVIQRECSPRYMLGINYLLLKAISKKSKIIWDFDDDIITSGEISKKELKLLQNKASIIIVISEYLKKIIKSKNEDNILCLPTTDGDIYKEINESVLEQRKEKIQTEIILVWVGTSVNLRNLDRIIPSLDELAKQLALINKKLVLKCVSGLDYIYNTKYLIIQNISWSRKNVIEAIKDSHIGLMPLPYNKFSLGKGGFKLIQYLSGSLPVIASNVGFNKEIVDGRNGFLVDDKDNIDCWAAAICELSNSNYKDFSLMAKNKYETKFNYNTNLQILKNCIYN